MCVLIKFKHLKVACVILINGAVKTGKSTLSVHLAYKHYRKNLRKYYIKKFFNRKKKFEKPLFYSNIPLKFDYVPITNEILTRVKRIPYGSVCYLGEFSLVADNMFYKTGSILQNETLMLFMKLFGHETGGSGKLFIDTQAVGDLPVNVRRCLSRYLYIERSIKWIPFLLVFKVRELMFSEDNSSINTFSSDIEDNCKTLIISKRIWKKFDYCCYSTFTDSLPVENNVVKGKDLKSLKVEKLPSFKKYLTIPTYERSEENGKQTIK